MIRKWLLIFLVIVVFVILTRLNRKSLQSRYPLLKRISSTITIVSWVLLAVYCLTFVYWLIRQVFM